MNVHEAPAKQPNGMKFAFFGTPEIACIVLNELERANFIPTLVVTNPDAPVGRKQIITPPPVKVWANERGIPVIQPTSLKNAAVLPELTTSHFDFFVVAAYGKIMPEWLLSLPTHGTLNVHPSLLPKLRGASPIRSAILQNERATGVTIMLMDAELDHGPIIIQEETPITESEWPLCGRDLDVKLATHGGKLLATNLQRFLQGELVPKAQNHEAATFCTKISKDMSELILNVHDLPTGDLAYQYLLKVKAFDEWPETFFIHNGKRIKIKDAEIRDNTFYPTRVVPEGKSEMDWGSYCK